MSKEKMNDVGGKVGVVVDEDKEPGRPKGAKGPLPNLKTMTKKDLIKEAGKGRKMLRKLESRIESVSLPDGGDPGGADVPQIPPELWGIFPSMAYDYLATRYGPYWKLKPDEIKLYGVAVEKVADKYLGVWAGDNPEIFGLVLVAVTVTTPRLLRAAAIAKEEKQAVNPGPKKVKKVKKSDEQSK